MRVPAVFLTLYACGCTDSGPRANTGFFQTTLRASEAYDQASKSLIIRDYAQRFSWYHQVDPDTIERILAGIALGFRGGA